MTDEDRTQIRLAVIAGPGDCGLDLDEAAALMGVSSSWLRRSDVPRVRVSGRVLYLKSECLKYMTAHLSHRVNAA